MTLSEIAAIADVLTAAAVVALLLFVAFQLRQNTRTIRDHVWEIHLDRVAANLSRALDSRVAAVLKKGRESFNSLDGDDKVIFSAWADEYLLQVGSLISFERQDLLHPDVAAMSGRRIKWFFEHPGAGEWWRSARRHPMPARLETVIGRACDETKPTGVDS